MRWLPGFLPAITQGLSSSPGVSVADASATEGVDAAVEFKVSLSQTASGTVTVDYATADASARAGEDYTAVSGTLTFASGERVKTVSVPILDDAIDEGRETFRLKLRNVQGARISDGEPKGIALNHLLAPHRTIRPLTRTPVFQGPREDPIRSRKRSPRRLSHSWPPVLLGWSDARRDSLTQRFESRVDRLDAQPRDERDSWRP